MNITMHRNSWKRLGRWLALLLLFAACGTEWSAHGDDIPLEAQLDARLEELRMAHLTVPRHGAAEQLIARTVVQTMLTKHYNYQPFTPQLSSQ